MPRFILEIGTEEMPARFLPALERALSTALAERLQESHVGFKGLEAFSTPRRLGIQAASMDAVQESAEEVVTGPPVRIAYDDKGNPTKAAEGFAKTQGVDLADTYTLATDKGEYLAVKKQSGGVDTLALLPEILVSVIEGLPFPKKMRWASLDFTFGRPLRWFLCLLGDQVVNFELAATQSSNQTWGHRVMGFGPFEVASADDYFSVLENECRVVARSEDRRALVLSQGEAAAKAVGGSPVWKDSLLEEVSGLVEYPKAILADFDPSFLEVPREVLLTSMEKHQKSFGVDNSQGELLPHFITVLNLESTDEPLVKKGWERVLKARLEDARFFWRTDLAKKLQTWVNELDNVIYLGPLGSMGDKSRRLETLCRRLAETVAPDLADDAARAGRLAKADLVSEMVGEFAGLQGVMGGIYARKQGESEAVAQAVYEHYLPEGQNSPVPESMGGALLSVADKLDTLVGCFGLKKIPTGAADPYGLRRGALGICRVILEKTLRLDLVDLLAQTWDIYGGIDWKLSREECLDALADFIGQRLKRYFTAQGYATLVVEAAVTAGIADVWSLEARIKALDEFSRGEDFEQAVLTFKRAGNIILKQGTEAGQELTGAYAADLLQEDAEKALAQALEQTLPRFETLWKEDKYSELMGLLRELRPSVDAFFDNVMVMCDDQALKVNRLNLLKALVDCLGRLADFNALQV